MKYLTSEVTLQANEYHLSNEEQMSISLARANKLMLFSTHVLYTKITGVHYDTLYRISDKGIFTLLLTGDLTKEASKDWAYNSIREYVTDMSYQDYDYQITTSRIRQ